MRSRGYFDYVKDQEEDEIFDEEHRELGKAWSFKYCDFLTEELLKDEDLEGFDILDVGCREFFTYDYFLEKYNLEIKGIDIGKKGLDYTSQNNKPAVYCDAHKLSNKYEEDTFDLVMSLHCLEHMFDLPKVLSEIYKCLKPDGYLYFAVPIPSHNTGRGHWYDIESTSSMEKMCLSVGFEMLYSNLFPPGKFREEKEMIGLFRKK